MKDYSNFDLKYIKNLYQMSDDALIRFVCQCHRAECYENSKVYMKGIRACLLALGFDEDFVEIHFRELMEKAYKQLY